MQLITTSSKIARMLSAFILLIHLTNPSWADKASNVKASATVSTPTFFKMRSENDKLKMPYLPQNDPATSNFRLAQIQIAEKYSKRQEGADISDYHAQLISYLKRELHHARTTNTLTQDNEVAIDHSLAHLLGLENKYPSLQPDQDLYNQVHNHLIMFPGHELPDSIQLPKQTFANKFKNFFVSP